MARRNRNNWIFILIILGLVFYILFDKGVFDNINLKKESKEAGTVVLENDVETPKKDIPSESKPSTPVQEMTSLEKCEVNLLKETTDKNTNYAKGKALVSFGADVSFSKAKNIVNDLNYSIEDESSAENRFNTGNKWFVVKVGSGNEFRAICKLRETTGVKNAIVEVLIPIHE